MDELNVQWLHEIFEAMNIQKISSMKMTLKFGTAYIESVYIYYIYFPAF